MNVNLLMVILLATCMGLSSCRQNTPSSDAVKEVESNADIATVSLDDWAVDHAIYNIRYQVSDSLVVHGTAKILLDRKDRKLSVQDGALQYNYFVFVRIHDEERAKELIKHAFLIKYLNSNHFYHSFVEYAKVLYEQSRGLFYKSLGAHLLNRRRKDCILDENELQISEQDTTSVYDGIKSVLYNISDSMVICKTTDILLDTNIHHLSTSEFATIYAYYLIGGIDEAASEAISDYVFSKFHSDISFTTSFIEHTQALKKKNKDELYRDIITDLAFSWYANNTTGEYEDNLKTPEKIKAFLREVSKPLYTELIQPEYKQLLISISDNVSAD